jgi:hypothetical protein
VGVQLLENRGSEAGSAGKPAAREKGPEYFRNTFSILENFSEDLFASRAVVAIMNMSERSTQNEKENMATLKTTESRIAHWNEAARRTLVGRKIVSAKYVQVDGEVLFAIQLDNGAIVIPMADDEGNGPGSLQVQYNPSGDGCLPTVY